MKFPKITAKIGDKSPPSVHVFKYVKNIAKYTKNIPILKASRCQNLFLKNRKSTLTIMAIKTTKDRTLIVVSTIFNHIVFILMNIIFNLMV